MNTGLTLVTNSKLITSKLEEIVGEALEHGVDTVVLREKEMNTRDLYNLAMNLKLLTAKYKKNLIINDRIDIALAVKAEGVHLGQNSLPLVEARKILSGNFTIGVSTHSLEEAINAENSDADYIFVGHIYQTQSKPGLAPRGPLFLKNIRERVNLPITAIGGINSNNVSAIVDTGIHNIAVMSEILTSSNVAQTVKELKSLLIEENK